MGTSIEIREQTVGNVLTRTGGYLADVSSHSLQPYRGCTFGNALCGVACYVQHNPWVMQGRTWGQFLDVRVNAAESYQRHVQAEARWARRERGGFSIFMSSSTDPFLPQERKYGVTQSVLEAMCDDPPDTLIVQTHSHRVVDARPALTALSKLCNVRVQVSIESDRDRLPGLPPPASSVAARLDACRSLREAGLFTVVTMAPLLPMHDPVRFFEQVAHVADAVVLDHFIEGDGSRDGKRTLKTALPAAMRQIDPESVDLAYRDRMCELARQVMPGRVGVSAAGFAGNYA